MNVRGLIVSAALLTMGTGCGQVVEGSAVDSSGDAGNLTTGATDASAGSTTAGGQSGTSDASGVESTTASSAADASGTLGSGADSTGTAGDAETVGNAETTGDAATTGDASTTGTADDAGATGGAVPQCEHACEKLFECGVKHNETSCDDRNFCDGKEQDCRAACVLKQGVECQDIESLFQDEEPDGSLVDCLEDCGGGDDGWGWGDLKD